MARNDNHPNTIRMKMFEEAGLAVFGRKVSREERNALRKKRKAFIRKHLADAVIGGRQFVNQSDYCALLRNSK